MNQLFGNVYTRCVRGSIQDRLFTSNILISCFVLVEFVIFQCFTNLYLTLASGMYFICILIAILLFFRKQYRACVLLYYISSSIMVMYACCALGWNFGFSLIPFEMIISFYYYMYVVGGLASSISICTPIVLSHLVIMGIVRFHVYQHGALLNDYSITTSYIISLINWICCGLMIIYFITLFIFSLKANNEELAEKNEQLRYMALYDSLTGFRNRQTIGDDIQRMIDSAKRDNAPFTLAICDIDDFKKVNDNYGHAQGDKVLMRISSTFMDTLPEDALVCRWGGEEFLIAFPTDLETAKNHVLKLQHKLSIIEFKNASDSYHITVTIGIQPLDAVDLDFSHLIQLADDHLYNGKHRGKNCVCYQNFIWRY